MTEDFKQRLTLMGEMAVRALEGPFVFLAWDSEDQRLHCISNMVLDDVRRMMKEFADTHADHVGSIEVPQ